MTRPLIAVILSVLCASGCSRQDQRLADHEHRFVSLSRTATAIVESWLSGAVSGTYAVTALDRTYALVEQERSTLTASVSMLRDVRGAGMSDSAAMLERRIADLVTAVHRADGQAARQYLADLPFRAAS